MLPTISYAICVHDEPGHYIKALLDQLLKHISPEDEIVVVDDFSTNEETLKTLSLYEDRINLNQHALNNDFAAHKNYMNSVCSKQYIFNVDCDEVPHDNLLKAIKEILLFNPNTDLFYVPRINIVQGITEKHIKEWGWRMDAKGLINYPDPQPRIYKNSPKLQWTGKVHETISGAEKYSTLPPFDEAGTPVPDYCLLHMKDISRQEKQNSYYNTIV